MERWSERSVLSVPLLFQDEVVGALALVEKRAPRRFTPDDLRLLELMAVPAAVAVHTARMLGREAEQTRRLGALLSASRAMASTIDLDDLLKTICHEARVALDTDECAIDTFDPDDGTLTMVALEQRVPQPDWEHWVGQCVLARRVPFRPAGPVRGGDRGGARLRPRHGRDEPRRDDRERREELPERAAPLRGPADRHHPLHRDRDGAPLHRRGARGWPPPSESRRRRPSTTRSCCGSRPSRTASWRCCSSRPGW